MTALWDIAPCSLVELYRRFVGVNCLHHQGALAMEAARTSETLVYFKETTRRYISEGCHFYTHSRENLKHDILNS
jgi:hypothetical protein